MYDPVDRDLILLWKVLERHGVPPKSTSLSNPSANSGIECHDGMWARMSVCVCLCIGTIAKPLIEWFGVVAMEQPTATPRVRALATELLAVRRILRGRDYSWLPTNSSCR